MSTDPLNLNFPKPDEIEQPKELTSDYKEREFLRAIAKVETNGNIRRGDNGKAWGKYQMHAIFVRDVNELLGTDYEHADAEHPILGEQLARDAYRAYYNYLSNRGIEPTPERLAYIWNGGRSAYKYLDEKWFGNTQGSVDEETRISMGEKRSNLRTYHSKFLNEYNKIQGVAIPITPPQQQEQQPILQETIQQVAQAAQNIPELIGMHGGDVNAGVVNEPTEDVPDLIGMHGGDVNAGVVPEPLD